MPVKQSWKEWLNDVPYPEDEGEPQGYTRRTLVVLWLLVFALWGSAYALHLYNGANP